MEFLLDTDIATLAFVGHEHVTPRLASQPAGAVGVPLATRLEILRGRIEAVMKAATADELRRAVARLADSERFLAPFPVAPVTDRAADLFEQLRAAKRTKKLDRGDLLNACIALAHDATLVTRNTRDYANVPGLKLANWAD